MSELAKALIRAQGQFRPAVKDSDNPFFRSKYADLESVWNSVSEALWANGLTLLQYGVEKNGDPWLATELLHVSGESRIGHYPLRHAPRKNKDGSENKEDPQSLAGAQTYARRYGAMAMVMVCPTDDDGETAAGRGPGAPTPMMAAAAAAGFPPPDKALYDEGKAHWKTQRIADKEAREMGEPGSSDLVTVQEAGELAHAFEKAKVGPVPRRNFLNKYFGVSEPADLTPEESRSAMQMLLAKMVSPEEYKRVGNELFAAGKIKAKKE